MPLVVDHGPNCTALGYKFFNVVYISDVKRIPSATRALIHQPHNDESSSSSSRSSSSGNIELFIVDALQQHKYFSSHFNLIEAVEEIRNLRPQQALLTGMSHDFDYHLVNTQLAALATTPPTDTNPPLNVQMAYDGMKVPITPINNTASPTHTTNTATS